MELITGNWIWFRVIISSDGYIVTNYHVIENAEKISITTNNNQNFEADIVGYDEQNDIALLKLKVKIHSHLLHLVIVMLQ